MIYRPRRLRRTDAIRRLVRENHVQKDDLMLPLFVAPGTNFRRDISSMPGNAQLSVDLLLKEIESMLEMGLRSTILFGIPEVKDEVGSHAHYEHGPVQEAIRAIKS